MRYYTLKNYWGGKDITVKFDHNPTEGELKKIRHIAPKSLGIEYVKPHKFRPVSKWQCECSWGVSGKCHI
jgi:hypothetical protein